MCSFAWHHRVGGLGYAFQTPAPLYPFGLGPSGLRARRRKREQKSFLTLENWSVGGRQGLLASLRFRAVLTLAGG